MQWIGRSGLRGGGEADNAVDDKAIRPERRGGNLEKYRVEGVRDEYNAIGRTSAKQALFHPHAAHACPCTEASRLKSPPAHNPPGFEAPPTPTHVFLSVHMGKLFGATLGVHSKHSVRPLRCTVH